MLQKYNHSFLYTTSPYAKRPQPFFFLLWRLLKIDSAIHFSFKIICIFYAYSYLCSTRTRQASQRCSNVRVVFFIDVWLQKIHLRKCTHHQVIWCSFFNHEGWLYSIEKKQSIIFYISDIIACLLIRILCFLFRSSKEFLSIKS